MNHAYLIVGGGTKERFEEALMRSSQILKISPANTVTHPDFHIIKSEESIKIEDVRLLQEKIALAPYAASYKTAVINNAHHLTEEAANALLKTLEEPPPHTVIFLLSINQESLLSTLVSRCQIIGLPYADENSFSLEEFKKSFSETVAILGKNIEERFVMAEKVKERTLAKQWLKEQIDLLRFIELDIINCKQFIPFNLKDVDGYLTIKNKLTTADIFNALKLFSQAKLYLENNCNVRLTLENLFLNLPVLEE